MFCVNENVLSERKLNISGSGDSEASTIKDDGSLGLSVEELMKPGAPGM